MAFPSLPNLPATRRLSPLPAAFPMPLCGQWQKRHDISLTQRWTAAEGIDLNQYRGHTRSWSLYTDYIMSMFFNSSPEELDLEQGCERRECASAPSRKAA